MDEVIRNMNGGQLIGFAAVVGGVGMAMICGLASIIAPNWRRARQVEAEAQLKRDLLAAGLSADEIERVVRATSVPSRPSRAELRYAARSRCC